MRPELTTLEQIDNYLANTLTSSEKAVFEEKMANDAALRQQVAEQQELIQAVNRKALRAQINAVAAAGGAAGGGSFGNLFLGIGGVLTVGLATAGIIYFSQGDETESAPAGEAIAQYEEEKTNDQSAEDYAEDLGSYDRNEEQLILEEPETIFSSHYNYEEESGPDKMNVTVNFQPQGYGEPVDYNQQNQNSGSMESEAGYTATNVPDFETERTEINRSSRAHFPGGNAAMDNFIDRNLHYPRSAWNKGIEGVVRCDFHVTADGLISEIDAECIKMSEGDGAAFSEMRQLMNKKIENAFIGNATHILRTMPHWEPAKNSQGNSVLSAQRMYFNYDMERGCLAYQLEDDVEILSQE